MSTLALKEDLDTTPPDCDQERFAARDNGDIESNSFSTPPDGSRRPPVSSSRARTLALSLIIVIAAVIVLADRRLDRALGIDLGLSLLVALPVYWAARTADSRFGKLVVVGAILLAFLSDFFAPVKMQPSWFPGLTASFHLAFLVVVVALAVIHRLLLSEREMVNTDFLTGIANGRGFHEGLVREIERSRRNHKPMTLAYLDCDGFKTVNDSLGHAAGNEVLAQTAMILKQNIRAGDLVGRLGGDEFAVLLVDMPAERSAEVVTRLRSQLRQTLKLNAKPVTFSIGAVTFADPPAGPNEAIRTADALMYQAKRAGKDRVVHVVGAP